jgi:hypothetical protein
MRTFVALLVLSSPLLAACQQAAAATDQEMTHCIGAFEFGKLYWRNQSPPNHRMAVTLAAGQIYYARKLHAAGVSDAGQAEAVAFVEMHATDSEFMMETIRSCGEAQMKDPEFKKQFTALASMAQQIDPVCKPNPELCAKR